MDTFFGPDFFTNNRTKLRAAMGSDAPIIITGNGQMQKSADEAYKFKQDSNFWYLTGLSAPDLTLVVGRQDTFLIVPELSFVREAFEGARNVTAYAARSGITSIVDGKTGWTSVKQMLAEEKTIASLVPTPSYIKHYGLHALPYRRRLIDKLHRINPTIAIQDVRTELANLRAIKQPEEIAAIQRAIDITNETLIEIANGEVLRTARHEYQIEAALSYGFRSRGANDHAFSPIVGAGAHSTTLHHTENNGPIHTSDLIVLDVGAEVEHYAADITRTVSQQPIDGRAAEVFNAVAHVQEFALSQIRPGVLPKEYERAVETYMGEQLRGLGVITTHKRDDIRRYFPHATSHFLGLDTHDAGDYQQPFQAGMVITCEPGIYLPEEQIGVRLEDDVLITEQGCQVLSAACPRELTFVK